MSADSPKRTVRSVPAVVPPQVVSDRSIIDSVTGFITDVTLANQPQVDPKDTILWARFENLADISDPTCGEDWELEGHVAPPLLLILGYGSGVQVWTIPANGEAVEVLSWRHGSVKALRILPTPISADDEMVEEPIDQFADKRPLMAICDSSSSSCNPQFCTANFVSLKNGTQVKTIKFKNPVLDILANRTSIVITFPERIAVFDARNLEDRLSVSTCHPSPGINPNPVALGSRWMAYSEWKLLPSKRSSGGCDCDGVSSYTATVLNAAKSLGKGLRELGEQMAAGLTGTTSHGGGGSSSKSGSFEINTGEIKQPGVITILDIKYASKEVSPTTGSPISVSGVDPVIAHFIAHSDAIVALEFDTSGMLLLTADKRGHDFHVFRIQPHPAGPHLAAVHHLYVLHRGDTSAKVQDIAFSLDSRWVAVSTLRGTTHVFPVTPYGGPAGFRTHGSLHVVNRLSRFHRSAGLSADGRSSSPISHSENTFNQSCMPYNNPRTPPFPRPTVVLPLAQLRQPSALGTPPGSAQNSYSRSTQAGRQRLSSLSDDSGKPLRVCAVFAKARSWLLDPPNLTRETPAHRMQRKVVDSIFIMAGHGALIQYDLDAKLSSNVAKEKVCDDTPIELEVEAKAQWCLGRKESSTDIQPPLSPDNWLMKERNCYSSSESDNHSKDIDDRNDRWLSQVEIITHAGPHRRLWMGPQFVFKTYNTPSGSPLSHIDVEAVEIGVNSGSNRPGRSSPMNMPLPASSRSAVPVLIESGSYSSIEQSPKLMDRFRHGHMDSDFALSHGESRLKEDLADAMRESPSVQHKDTGLTPVCMSSQSSSSSALTASTDRAITTNSSTSPQSQMADMHKSSISPQPSRSATLIEKVVNPLGTVTTITRSPSDNEFDGNNMEYEETYVIHENCDEALFRPVVAIFCDDKDCSDKKMLDSMYEKPPEIVGSELIVPVVEEASEQKNVSTTKKKSLAVTTKKEEDKPSEKEQIAKFDEMSLVNKKNKAGKKMKVEKEKSPPSEPLKKTSKPKKEPISTEEIPADTQPVAKVVEETNSSAKVLPLKVKNAKQDSVTEVTLPSKTSSSSTKKKLEVVTAPEFTEDIETKDEEEIKEITSAKPEPQVEKQTVPEPPVLEETISKDKNKKEETLTATKTELKFYEKFSEDVPKLKEPKQKASAEIPKPEVIEFPSISESIGDKKSKKQKNGSPSPKHSPKMLSKQCEKKKEEEEKTETDTSSSKECAPKMSFAFACNRKTKKIPEDTTTLSEKVFVFGSPAADETVSETKTKPAKPKPNEKPETGGGNKTKKSEKNNKTAKTQDISKLSFEIISPEFSDTFLQPLSPLEPFESSFDTLHFKNTSDELISLINFESPLQEKEPIAQDNTTTTNINKTKTHKYTEENLIFALCGSLHEDENLKASTSSTPPPIIQHCTEKDNDIDEQYLSLEQHYHEAISSTSSSEETEESTCNIDKKHHRRKLDDDDEELRPLISGANSASSMTSSTGKKEDSTIELEIAKAIIDTLPDNNHSDSSDQANNSEPQEIDDTQQDDIKHQQQQQQQQAQQQHTATVQATSTIGGNQHNSNGKKKSKKKKR